MQTVQTVGNNFTDSQLVELFSAFLSKIGISIINAPSNATEIQLDKGLIHCNFNLLKSPGNLLRVASRLAICRPEIREQLTEMGVLKDERKEEREIAALLWTYAACKDLGIKPEAALVNEHSKGETEWLLDNFNRSNYIGLPLICYMGLTSDALFPSMLKWIRE